jgi:flagellar hook-basal body complex protein FliE
MADIPSILSTGSVSGAYRTASSLRADKAALPEATPDKAATFADMVRDATADAIQTIRETDAIAQAGMDGKVDTQQVVEATLELESTVRIAVTMRDKLVEAYQEIMRMPI